MDVRLPNLGEGADSGSVVSVAVKEGDSITIDAHRRLLQLNVTTRELAERKKKWRQPKPRYTRGVLAKYSNAVTSASLGAVTDLNLSV